MYKIINMGNGWYNFSRLPQGYIVIHNRCCGSDIKATRQARKMIGDKNAEIIIERNPSNFSTGVESKTQIQ
jgi:hypothetical protein